MTHTKNPLKQYAHNKFSQNGEDGIIKKIFEILPKQEARWCVEFGAWDGQWLSNTYELIANHNWNGVLIEGNKKKMPDLKQTYKGNPNAVLINKLVSFEGNDTLDNILEKTDIPKDFDLLSIDIDGNDYHIWDAVQNYQPKAVVIEFNPSIPSDIEFVQKKEFTLNQGTSLLAMINLGKSKGYELVATTNCNGFFVRKEYFPLFDIADNSITAMWDTEKPAPRLFQLFDGTLVLTDEFDLIWHNKHVNKNDLQALPKSLRSFTDSPHIKGLYTKMLKKIYYKFQPAKNKRH